MSESSELLTAEELAAHLRMKSQTIRLWARSGKIPSCTLSRKAIRFVLSDVLAALKSQTAKGASNG